METTRERVHGDIYNTQKIKYVSASYSMKPTDFCVHASGASAAVSVTLPSIAEAAVGVPYIVKCTDASNDVSVLVKESGSEYTTYGDLDTAGDVVCLMSDGSEWQVCWSDIT